MRIPDRVREKLKNLPDKPGVYIMRDRRGKVIYVGKAISLRKRVQSYFRQGTLRSAEPKLRGLIRSIEELEVHVLRNEAEATLTESRLIKDYRPRYNVSWKDDKRFLLLKISMDDPYPRFQTTRLHKDDGAVYFGPYTNAAAVRAAKEFVEKRFGIRVCRPRVPGETDYKHCLNDIIRTCSAPCVARIDRAGYIERVEEACAFLRGDRPHYLKEVREAMEKASAAMQFERAAAIRDTYLLLHRAVKERASVRRTPAMKQADAVAGLDELKKLLSLAARPDVIETFDISNISGTLAVGSMVCAVDGVPDPRRYRLFRIRTVEGSDDPAMMSEVVRRRYERLLREQKGLPGLVLVDGGITQVRAARAALDSLKLEALPVAGLAKRFEEIVCDRGRAEPIRLPRDSIALQVLQRIRDEAHRFALTYHRKLRARRIRESLLDEIPGIGRKRKQELLEHFGSVARLRRASAEEIAQVPGFGGELAALVRDSLRRG